jgi:hypothetical protein
MVTWSYSSLSSLRSMLTELRLWTIELVHLRAYAPHKCPSHRFSSLSLSIFHSYICLLLSNRIEPKIMLWKGGRDPKSPELARHLLITEKHKGPRYRVILKRESYLWTFRRLIMSGRNWNDGWVASWRYKKGSCTRARVQNL